MIRSDGGSVIHPQKSGISLIQVGIIDPGLFTTLHAALQSFVGSLSGKVRNAYIEVGFLKEPHFPVLRHSGWENAYSSLLADSHVGTILIATTRQGFWESLPQPRFIFCSAVRPGAAALSLYRFQRMNPGFRQARVQKAVIKGLGMALGMSHCNDLSCILSHHWFDEDFDRNTGVSDACIRVMKDRLKS
jgi:hypothetical protein